ncbi:vesicle-associated membrane protein 7-like [Pectinophora gossypiella]|uniref:vesicle-associated membrane protein 7-like n=1 Tax=Pectinophora gossypiella TaxID=13191 RepID=UPI00214F0D38|nr:vesicle-associated membrane protein 7-like [Pectinophora gossypiella]
MLIKTLAWPSDARSIMSGGNKNDKLEEARGLVDETVKIMNNNMEAIWEREDKLQILHGRVEDLQEGAQQFQRRSAKVKMNYIMKNLQLTIIIVILIAILIALVLWVGL